MEGLIPAWSYSRLKDFEKCPYKVYLTAVEKRSTDHTDKTALNRGIQVHGEAEAFARGDGDITEGLAKFADYFVEVRDEVESGTTIIEDDWGFDLDWQITGWWDDDVWCRMKLDNFRVIEGTIEEPIVAQPTDYKTGKKYGNEVSHAQQGQLYSIGSFMRFPSLQTCEVSIKYLDKGLESNRTYTREQAMVFLPHWNKRALKLTQATDFPPRANKQTCMWCPFGPQNGDASCDWGV